MIHFVPKNTVLQSCDAQAKATMAKKKKLPKIRCTLKHTLSYSSQGEALRQLLVNRYYGFRSGGRRESLTSFSNSTLTPVGPIKSQPGGFIFHCSFWEHLWYKLTFVFLCLCDFRGFEQGWDVIDGGAVPSGPWRSIRPRHRSYYECYKWPCLPRKHPIGHCTVGGREHHHTGQKGLSVKWLSDRIKRCGIKLFSIHYSLKDGVSKTLKKWMFIQQVGIILIKSGNGKFMFVFLSLFSTRSSNV